MLGEIKYFAENGFIRKKCSKCGDYYHTRDKNRDTCGDAPCDPYSFIGAPLLRAKNTDEMRAFFLSFFEKRGHTRIAPYPVIARWRDDVLLTNASIYNFQPWVTSGKVPPPANPLVISQPCIRLDDIESVGLSGRHLTTFEMMAHHAFNSASEKIYWKDETIEYCDVLLRELGAPLEKITYKEEQWFGGGNAGPCVEVLLGGLELATLVFMEYERSPKGSIVIENEKYARMERQIVDTGYGLERFTWASLGTPTIYDAIFPEVVSRIFDLAGVGVDPKGELASVLAQKARVAGLMGDIKGANLQILRGEVAKLIGIPVDRLVKMVEPVEMSHAVADHARCLAFMLRDGIIPSNVKAGYLARLVIRRTLRMMESLQIKGGLSQIVLMHLRNPPEELVGRISEILELEEKRYEDTIGKGKRLVARISEDRKKKEKEIPLDEIIDLYDTHGIPPEITRSVAESAGIGVKIPDNFYSLVAKKHSKVEREEAEMHSVPQDISKTRKLYYEAPTTMKFDGTVMEVLDSFLILDQTAFYPEGGGQPGDIGFLSSNGTRVKVVDVKDAGGVILHKVERSKFKKGDKVSGEVDVERRMSLTRHHTATHVVLEAAKKVLGSHVWQAGAQKGEESTRLDIAHFKRITPEEIAEIEMLANRMVMANIPVKAEWVDRTEAEKRHGFVLYQGGVPPGSKIRTVTVGENVQACAGTHCLSTGLIGAIKILKTERVQDGVERLEFAAGEAAIRKIQEAYKLLGNSADALSVPPEKLPASVERFFEEWKELKKESTRLKETLAKTLVDELVRSAKKIAGIDVVAKKIEDVDAEALIKVASELSRKKVVAILASVKANEAKVVVASHGKIDAREIMKKVCEVLGGGGGGRAELAQGGGPKVEKLDEALEAGVKAVEDLARAKKEKKD
jgi:alanyl-tRNA synthetase